VTSAVLSRDAAELVSLPFTFTQLDPLRPDEFLKLASARGYALSHHRLEALHRSRLLFPLLRASRDGRTLRGELRRAGPQYRYRYLGWDAKWHLGTRAMLAVNVTIKWHDPAEEEFIPVQKRRLRFEETEYPVTQYIYSPYQAIMLPFIKRVLRSSEVLADASGAYRLIARRDHLTRWQAEASRLRDVVIAASALEARYYFPHVSRSYRAGPSSAEQYRTWREETRPEFFTDWLNVDGDWLTSMATELLSQADSIDPLAEWLDLVRLVPPQQWQRLRGDARTAIDIRIAAELLLACRDAIATQRTLHPDEPQVGEAGALATRLTTKRRLDEVLTEYGLSPHPSLVVVLEGKTEMTVWPRLLDYYGVSHNEDFITVIDGHGVDTDLTSLMTFAAPRVTPWHTDGVLQLVRPATRFLIVSDPENKMATSESRDKRRSEWVTLLFEAIPVQYRTPALLNQLDLLVFTETWNDADESFEFANFTPREIARAIKRLPEPVATKPLDELVQIVESIRSTSGNLKHFEDAQLRKGNLVIELWPILKGKLDRATPRGTHLRIPAVRILQRAVHLASEFPRDGLLLDGRTEPNTTQTEEPDMSEAPS
jgi:hypothetical protein